MRVPDLMIPFLFALIAAIGNALVTIGQKNAASYANPFVFGAFSLALAAIGLFIIAFFYQTNHLYTYVIKNFKWFAIAGGGMLVLNIFLYFLYRGYGANSYTLYAILAIMTTSIGVSVFYYHEKMNVYYLASLIFAVVTVLFFLKGKSVPI